MYYKATTNNYLDTKIVRQINGTEMKAQKKALIYNNII